MPNLINTIFKIHSLDDLSRNKTFIHGLHPLTKIFITIAYILFVISFTKYDVSALLPYSLFPIVTMALGEVPIKSMIGAMFVALFFVLFLGLFNLLYDHNMIMTLGPLSITGGMVSFVALIAKSLLCIMATLLLLATTKIHHLGAAFCHLKVPRLFVLQLLFTYRYIILLLEESSRITTAYILRSHSSKGIASESWGPLLGQLFIRTFDRALRIHQAMSLRGFDGSFNGYTSQKISSSDILYMSGWAAFFITARNVNLSYKLSHLLFNIG